MIGEAGPHGGRRLRWILRSAQTARQHATAVYRKSGLAGRAEPAAFFLEDLMLPDDRRAVVRARGPDE